MQRVWGGCGAGGRGEAHKRRAPPTCITPFQPRGAVIHSQVEGVAGVTQRTLALYTGHQQRQEVRGKAQKAGRVFLLLHAACHARVRECGVVTAGSQAG